MYVKQTVSRKKVIEVLANNFRLLETTGKKKQAMICSILCWELVGLRICRFSYNDYIEVYNPENHKTEFKFDLNTGEEIV